MQTKRRKLKKQSGSLLYRLLVVTCLMFVAAVLIIETVVTRRPHDIGHSADGTTTIMSRDTSSSAKIFIPNDSNNIDGIKTRYAPRSSKTGGEVEVDVIFPVSGNLGDQLWQLSRSQHLIESLEEQFSFEKGLRIKIKAHYNKKKHTSTEPKVNVITRGFEGEDQTTEAIRRCFPFFSKKSFFSWESENFINLQKQQYKWIREHPTSALSAIPVRSEHEIITAIEQVVLALEKDQAEPFGLKLGQDMISIPFVEVSDFSSEILSTAETDIVSMDHHNPSCCNQAPHNAETVLHIRGTSPEMEKDHERNSLEEESLLEQKSKEISPKELAQDFLSYLQPNDRVAVVSQFPESIGRHVQELQSRGVNVRIIKGQTDIQDFCFLQQGIKLAGRSGSTFFKWAAKLSEANRVESYRFDGKNFAYKRKTTALASPALSPTMAPTPSPTVRNWPETVAIKIFFESDEHPEETRLELYRMDPETKQFINACWWQQDFTKKNRKHYITVRVQESSSYKFVIKDSAGNGIATGDGFWVTQWAKPVFSGDRNFGSEGVAYFDIDYCNRARVGETCVKSSRCCSGSCEDSVCESSGNFIKLG